SALRLGTSTAEPAEPTGRPVGRRLAGRLAGGRVTAGRVTAGRAVGIRSLFKSRNDAGLRTGGCGLGRVKVARFGVAVGRAGRAWGVGRRLARGVGRSAAWDKAGQMKARVRAQHM
ncbi:MAG: hypothetical protein ABGX05_06310, partial [Pirellulaceae bacterium]